MSDQTKAENFVNEILDDLECDREKEPEVETSYDDEQKMGYQVVNHYMGIE